MMVVIRYISKVLVWILTILVIIGSIGNFLEQRTCSSTVGPPLGHMRQCHDLRNGDA